MTEQTMFKIKHHALPPEVECKAKCYEAVRATVFQVQQSVDPVGLRWCDVFKLWICRAIPCPEGDHRNIDVVFSGIFSPDMIRSTISLPIARFQPRNS